MKQPKKLTLKYKKMLKLRGLVPENWMLLKEEKDHIVVISKNSNRTRKIYFSTNP